MDEETAPSHRANEASDATSRQLLECFLAGESRAASAIVQRYTERLFRLVSSRLSHQLRRRVDAEDVVQSALHSFFIRARDEAYVLRTTGDLWRLLATIALSKLRRQVEINTAQKRAMAIELPSNEMADFEDGMSDEPSAVAAIELVDEIDRLMRTFAREEQQIFRLRIEGSTIEEIAEQVRRSQRTVRRILQTIRLRLEQRLSDLNDL